MMRVLKKTYKISVTVQEPAPRQGIAGDPGIGMKYNRDQDPFWDAEDMRFMRRVWADDIVESVRAALKKEPMFSYGNVEVRLDGFGYE
jgi:hypothetical protein